MAKTNVIAIGCFYKVVLPVLDDPNAAPETEFIMIGCIFSRVESENIRN